MYGIFLALVYAVQSVSTDIGKEFSPTEAITRGYLLEDMTDDNDNSDAMAVQNDATHATTNNATIGEASRYERPEINNEETISKEGLQSGATTTVEKPNINTNETAASKVTLPFVEEDMKIKNTPEENLTEKKTVNNTEKNTKGSGTFKKIQNLIKKSTHLQSDGVNPKQSLPTEEIAKETKFVVNLQDINSNTTRGRINLPYKGSTSAQSVKYPVYEPQESGKSEGGKYNRNNTSSKDKLSSEEEEESFGEQVKLDYSGTDNVKYKLPKAQVYNTNSQFTEVGPSGAPPKEHASVVDDEDCLFDHQRFDVDTIGNTTPSNETVSTNTEDKTFEEKSVTGSLAEKTYEGSSVPNARYEVQTEHVHPFGIQLQGAEKKLMMILLNKIMNNILLKLSGRETRNEPSAEMIAAEIIRTPAEDVDWQRIVLSTSQVFQRVVNNLEDIKNNLTTQPPRNHYLETD